MTDLVIAAANSHAVEIVEQDTFPAGAAINAGQWVYVDTNGKWQLANATTATLGGNGRRAYALKTVIAGQSLTAVYRGVIDCRGALDGLAIGAQVFLSNTVGGVMADVAGTVSIVLGNIIAGWASGATPDKLLRIIG